MYALPPPFLGEKRTALFQGGVLPHELPHEVGDPVAVFLQGEVAGVEQMVLDSFQVLLVRLGPCGREDRVVLAPHDEGGRLVLAEGFVPAAVRARGASDTSETARTDPPH